MFVHSGFKGFALICGHIISHSRLFSENSIELGILRCFTIVLTRNLLSVTYLVGELNSRTVISILAKGCSLNLEQELFINVNVIGTISYQHFDSNTAYSQLSRQRKGKIVAERTILA